MAKLNGLTNVLKVAFDVLSMIVLPSGRMGIGKLGGIKFSPPIRLNPLTKQALKIPTAILGR